MEIEEPEQQTESTNQNVHEMNGMNNNVHETNRMNNWNGINQISGTDGFKK